MTSRGSAGTHLLTVQTCGCCLLIPQHKPSHTLLFCGAGVPFRETHHISGAAVKLAEDKGCTLFDLTVDDLAGINPLFTEDVTSVWSCRCMPL